MGLGVGSADTGKFCNLYTHFSLETVFPALKLTQNYYLHNKMFSLENWQFNHKLAPPLLRTCHKGYSHHLTKYEEGKGTSAG